MLAFTNPIPLDEQQLMELDAFGPTPQLSYYRKQGAQGIATHWSFTAAPYDINEWELILAGPAHF